MALTICMVLDAILNKIIGLAIIIELVLLVFIWAKFIPIRKMALLLDNKTIEKTSNTKSKKEKRTTYHVTKHLGWDDYENVCKKYQKNIWLHTAYLQIIQLLPLLGILGTVAGLYIAINTNSEWTNAQGLYDGVKLALSSTVYGIIGAVIFKIFDIFNTTVLINNIEDRLDLFRNNYMEDKDITNPQV